LEILRFLSQTVSGEDGSYFSSFFQFHPLPGLGRNGKEGRPGLEERSFGVTSRLLGSEGVGFFYPRLVGSGRISIHLPQIQELGSWASARRPRWSPTRFFGRSFFQLSLPRVLLVHPFRVRREVLMEKLQRIEEYLENEKRILEIYERDLVPLLKNRREMEKGYATLTQLRLVELTPQGPPKPKGPSAPTPSTSTSSSTTTPQHGGGTKRKLEGEGSAALRFDAELDKAGDNQEAEEVRRHQRLALEKKSKEDQKKKKSEAALSKLKGLNILTSERGSPHPGVEGLRTDSTQNFNKD